MKFLILPMFLFSLASYAQINNVDFIQATPAIENGIQQPPVPVVTTGKTKIAKVLRWRLDKNKILTGGLIFTAGAVKGFNESLQYKYRGFETIFPKANDQWFYPTFSFKNKYKDGDPEKGERFPLSTSVLVMFTDQYHLNNFIHQAALTGALVIKIGDGKKPLRQYIFDFIYYTVCYQAGFHSIFAPISARNLQ